MKFGSKPTLRIVPVVTMREKLSDELAYAIAEKQLYSSHYSGGARPILVHPWQ